MNGLEKIKNAYEAREKHYEIKEKKRVFEMEIRGYLYLKEMGIFNKLFFLASSVYFVWMTSKMLFTDFSVLDLSFGLYILSLLSLISIVPFIISVIVMFDFLKSYKIIVQKKYNVEERTESLTKKDEQSYAHYKRIEDSFTLMDFKDAIDNSELLKPNVFQYLESQFSIYQENSQEVRSKVLKTKLNEEIEKQLELEESLQNY